MSKFDFLDVRGRIIRRIGKYWWVVVGAIRTVTLSVRGKLIPAPLIDPTNEVVVSLTSHGNRLHSVNLTIESIGRGVSRPGRLILWIDPDVRLDELPPRLLRLQRRGLEVMVSPGMYGPHTKYFPYVRQFADAAVPLVTADDDSLYPRWWLRKLLLSATKAPEDIVCYRAHRVALTGVGGFAPYNSWQPVRTSISSSLHFATGVSGVWYPPNFLFELERRGEEFQQKTPRNDDVWLHFVAVSTGRGIRQVARRSKKFPEAARTQGQALHRTNTALSQNDRQIAATYPADVILRLQQVESRS